MTVNRLAYFLAGAVLGAAGVAMVKSGKGQHLFSGMIHGGCGLAENVLARVETVKEDIEDYMAEAKYKAEQAKEAACADVRTSEEPIVEKKTAPEIRPDVESEEELEIDEEDPRQFYR